MAGGVDHHPEEKKSYACVGIEIKKVKLDHEECKIIFNAKMDRVFFSDFSRKETAEVSRGRFHKPQSHIYAPNPGNSKYFFGASSSKRGEGHRTR